MGFVDSEDLATRLSTARAVKGSGFVPVPIIAARRLRSEEMLREYLSGLRAADASDCVLVVAGDPAQPRGPYPDAASVIGSGLLEDHGSGRPAWPVIPEGTPESRTVCCGRRWLARPRRWSCGG